MDIKRAAPANELLAKLIFLIAPTIIAGYYLLLNINQYYSVIQAPVLRQTAYLASGMGISAVLYSLRFRFLPTFLLLIAGLYSIYLGLDRLAIGEFDTFFISVKFLVFAILFTIGWLAGWGFIRLRYWSVFMASLLLSICILLIAKANAASVYGLMASFAPALLYAVYIIFTAEQIYSYKDKSQKFWWFLSRRLVAFGLLSLLIFGGVYYTMRAEIKETVANYGGGGKSGENSMLKQNKDGSFDLKNYSQLRGSLGRSNELLFCARIDNFFPGTQIPNPLYLTAFYYTKFDTLTETFERDSTIPYNDLFEPDPSRLPLFSTKCDTSVITNSLSDKLRKIVEIQVYSKKLSPTTYVAPNVGFFVQPVTVEKDFREEFKSAFRAKSYVSELNSAYFVYNAQDKQIKKFQEQRFAVLRKVTDYSGVDPKFIRYYTFMPVDAKFKSISALAHKVTAQAQTPVDKIIAIRDYFLSKDDNGDALYKYTDNPGIPDIPSASKLLYFLNENHKGYCAYFAGATLFMLRSLGIPSRIAVGFLTVDRSDKNKGWYWYYADQAHAWVQVFFPGYGWIDFDTTVGNSDARESPKPDGTPPMQPPKAWLAADGIIEDIDTVKKTMVLKVKHMVFHDKEYSMPEALSVPMDLHIATISRDSIKVPLAMMKKGEEATAVSYADAIKKLDFTPNESGAVIIKRFPNPAPIDEVYLKLKDSVQKEEKKQAIAKQQPFNVSKAIWTAVGILAGILLLVFSSPSIVWIYYKYRYRSAKKYESKAYWAYRASGFYLHQLGFFRGLLTPMAYARTIIDPEFGTAYAGFMNIYLKIKYAKQPLSTQEQSIVDTFLNSFIGTIRKKTPFKTRLSGFLRPMRTVSFFVAPEDNANAS